MGNNNEHPFEIKAISNANNITLIIGNTLDFVDFRNIFCIF
jgi:hypothetical protein